MAGLGRRTHYRKHLTDSILHDLPEPKSDCESIAKVVNTRGGNQFDVLLPTTKKSISTDGVVGDDNQQLQQTPQLAILPTKFHKLVWVKRGDFVIVQMGITDDGEEKEEANKNIDSATTDNDDENDDNDSEPKTASPSSSENQSAGGTAAASGGGGGGGDGGGGVGTGIRFMITHILYKDQVKHLKSNGFWPENDPEFGDDDHTEGNNHNRNHNQIRDDNDRNHSHDDNDNDEHDNDEQDENADDGIVYNGYYDDDNDDDLFINTNRLARLEVQDSDSSSESENE